MSSNEARLIVEAGLERKKSEQREAALEAQARKLRLTISGNHAQKSMSEIQLMVREEEEARRRSVERTQAKAARAYREMKAEEACRRYGIVCLLILLMTAITRINVWVSISLVLGLAVFPAADIYRLFVPTEDVKK